jgi:hypothetical protein
MKQNACQRKTIKNILLNKGYITRNRIIKEYGITRLSKYINDLRKEYVIDTIHYKKRKSNSWGNCVYILNRSLDRTYYNKKYPKQYLHFIKTNKIHLIRNKFFTNDY